MRFADSYIRKNQFRKLELPKVPNNSGPLHYIVIIPAFSEPDIFPTLQSLAKCKPPQGFVQVFILINYSEAIGSELKQQNDSIFDKLQNWCKGNQSEWLNFHPFIERDLPEKHAGAGLARKILMDAAAEQFSYHNNAEGIILSLDADTLVSENYFIETEKASTYSGCVIFNFEHELAGNDYHKKVYKAAIQYELHLRYYKQILEQTGFPYSYYTIGSCFGVNANLYCKLGGMSKRKAGEDFYFLQKVFPNTQTTFLINTRLVPSVRPSWRVPFGTGPAIRNLLGTTDHNYQTYHPRLFKSLTGLTEQIDNLYKTSPTDTELILGKLHEYISTYLQSINAVERIAEVNKNSSSLKSFKKRFYGWFDAFQVIKFLNFASENYLKEIDVTTAAKLFLNDAKYEGKTAQELLITLRNRDLQ